MYLGIGYRYARYLPHVFIYGSFEQGVRGDRVATLVRVYLCSVKKYVLTTWPSTYIYFEERENATRNALNIYVGSAPTEHLDGFDERLQNSLKRIAGDGFDMKRMKMVIDRDERQLRSKVESSKGDTFSGTVITDFLYGAEDGSNLGPALDEISRYDVLRTWSSDDWVRLLRK